MQQGATQKLSLYWTAPADATPPLQNLKYSVRLLNAQGAAVWQADVAPGAIAGQPWPGWQAGAAPRDDLLISVPADTAPGAYTLILSAYQQQGSQFTGAPFTCPDSASGALTLARPTVIARLRD